METEDQNRLTFFRCFSTPLWGSLGLCPGPTHFLPYIQPLLVAVISKFNVTHHLYADDTQIYLEFDSRNFDSSTTELQTALRQSSCGWEITNLN